MMDVGANMEQLAGETEWLRRLARALVRDSATAEDLVQDTFVTAAEQAPTDGRPLRPWLHRVLVNRARMIGRSGSRRRAREGRLGELAAAPAGPHELVAQIETQRLLSGLVLALPPGQRDVVLLHYFEGLSSVEIGVRLGIPAGTARWRLKQAIDELRAKLEERHPNRAWVVAVGELGTSTGRPATGVLVPVLLMIALAIFAVVAIAVHLWSRDVDRAAPAIHARVVASPPKPTRAMTGPMFTTTHADGAIGAELAVLRIEGQVIDADEQPVAGASVHIEVECNYAAQPQADVVTSSDGSFVFLVEPRCQYRLVTFAHGAVARALLSKDPSEPVILKLASEHLLQLRVVDIASEVPIPDATIRFDDGVTLSVDREGRATHPLGTLRSVFVTAPGRKGVHWDLDNAWKGEFARVERDRATGRWKWTPLPPGSPPPEKVIPLEAGTSHAAGTLRDHDGVPAANCFVVAWMNVPSTHGFGPAWSTALTDGHGAFTLALTPMSGWDYEARAWCELHGRETAWADNRVVDVRSPIELRLERRVRRDVTITVLDEAGRPAVRAELSTMQATFRTGYTDDRGQLTISDLEVRHSPGETSVIAKRGDLASLVTELHDETALTLRLEPTGITGLIINGEGRPVTDGWIRLLGSKHVNGRQQTVDPQGGFVLDVPPGVYTLQANRDGDFGERETGVTVRAAARGVRIPIE